jgi:hypothetical protein
MVRNNAPDIELSEQTILNRSFDKTFGTLVTQPLNTPMAMKITVVTTITYIAKAPTSSLQADPVWQCQKIDESVSGTTIITWADDGKYTQIATDITEPTITYS